MPANGPAAVRSVVMPRSASPLLTTNLPEKTPIEPVSVPGSATILSASADIQYPPEAATDPIDTTIFLPAASARTTIRRTDSDPETDPPGLSIRNTIALIDGLAIARGSPAVTALP